MRLVLLFVLVAVQLSATLDCYNARGISLEKAFGLDLYADSRKNTTMCTIRAIYDAAPNEVVSVTMYSEVNTTKKRNGCNIQRYRYPKERPEHRWHLKTSDHAVIYCHCDRNLCNGPELIMDYLGHEDGQLNLIESATVRVYEISHKGAMAKSKKYSEMTIATLTIVACFFLANLVFVAVIFIGRGRGAGSQELFPARRASGEGLSDEPAEYVRLF